MNPKLQKLRAELEKNTEKISKLQSRNAELKSRFRSWRTSTSSTWCASAA